MSERFKRLPPSPPSDGWRQTAEVVNRIGEQVQPFHIRSCTAAVTASETYGLYVCDATSAGFTVTLPEAGGYKGKRFHIKKVDATANLVIVDGYSAETIDGQAAQTITTQYECITVVSDGTQWWIV